MWESPPVLVPEALGAHTEMTHERGRQPGTGPWAPVPTVRWTCPYVPEPEAPVASVQSKYVIPPGVQGPACKYKVTISDARR